MPELPEVETTRAGLAPHLEGQRVRSVTLRRADLRWPIPPEITECLPGQRMTTVRRRAKYLLFDTAAGSAVCHLGMSGCLRVLPANTPVGAHDHVDVGLPGNRVLRLTDPRRFGCLLWQWPGEIHPLLRDLGPEPLSDDFDGDWLYHLSRQRRAPVKGFLMDQRIVVGVGNIYANEALFAARISPLRPAGRISRERYRNLADAVKRILTLAIARGGTTLRDFLSPDSQPGYFEQDLMVYGRGGEPCPICGRPLHQRMIAQRNTVWCGSCQR